MVDEAAVTVCICTRNRPRDLEHALASVMGAIPAPNAVVVSDDSTDDRTREMVGHYPGVTYVAGPRAGLGANRNAALAVVGTSHVAFLDDDACWRNDHLTHWSRRRESTGGDISVIVSGVERNGGRTVAPSGPTFLGHQSRAYRPGEQLETVVINAAIFPTWVLKELGFDPQLIYGSDEVDVSVRAIRRGCRIVFDEQLVVDHRPSPVNRDYYASHAEAARLYATLKRYARIERSFCRTLTYVVVAPVHLVLHCVGRAGAKGAPAAVRVVWDAYRMTVRARQ